MPDDDPTIDLEGLRDEFGPLSRTPYLVHHRRGLLSRSALAACQARLTEAHERGDFALVSWREQADLARAALLAMIGDEAGERWDAAFFQNTTHAIAAVAMGLDWRAGDVVVSNRLEYPANVYPWMEAARRFEVELVRVEPIDLAGRVPIEVYERALIDAGGRARIVAVSEVSFCTGLAIDVPALARLCREHGAKLLVDVVQSIGCLPQPWLSADTPDADAADFVCGDARKWLGGLDGAGFLIARPYAFEELRPTAVGASSVIALTDYLRHELTLRDSARRFDGGSSVTLSLAALAASAGVWRVQRAFAGADRVFAAQQNTVACLERARQNEPALRQARGAASLDGAWISALREGEASGLVVAHVDESTLEARRIAAEQAGVRVAFGDPLPLSKAVLARAGLTRAPARVLFAPHAYTPASAVVRAGAIVLPELGVG